MEALGITRGAAAAMNDLLDTCAEIKAGDEVVVVAHVDGLQGGDNLVDQQTIAWVQAGIQARGANPTILWIDEPARLHAWRVPPVMLAALKASKVFINCSFDLTIEEHKVIQETATECQVTLCRLMATTVGLLNSPWAQTPYELVSEIRYRVRSVWQRESALSDGGRQRDLHRRHDRTAGAHAVSEISVAAQRGRGLPSVSGVGVSAH